jgi:superfamily II DNA or RNA helicase
MADLFSSGKPSLPLWPHQTAALAAVRRAMAAGTTTGLIVLPTGAGKTVTFCTLAHDVGLPTLVLVHRDELIEQTLKTARRVWPHVSAGVVQAQRDQWRGGETLVVASVQSLHARRLALMPRDRFGLVVVDEAHHAAATYGAILGHFQARFRLGVTATPERLDGQGLADWFGPEPLFAYPIRRAIADKVLVPIRQFQIRTGISLESVTTRGGDFAEGELAATVNNQIRNAAVVDAYLQHAGNRRAIVFAVDLDHVAALVAAFRAKGVRAESVTGKDKLEVRRQTLQDFALGRFQVLVNCQIATEGFDDPAVDCILMARPTQSKTLYTQCVGRGLRRCDDTGKTNCLILDITDNCKRHKLMTASSLLGSEPDEDTEVEEEEPAPVPEPGDGTREKRAVRHTDEPVSWRLAEVSPWPELPNLTGYEPRYAWQAQPASEGQLRYLRSFGLGLKRELTKGEAAHLIDKAIKYDADHPTPPTDRQEWFLRMAGQWQDGMTKREATKLIGQLKGGAGTPAAPRDRVRTMTP